MSGRDSESRVASLVRTLRVGLGLVLAVLLFATVLATTLATRASAQATESNATGTISGRVFDGANGKPIENATIILIFPAPADGSEPHQEVTTSGPAGDYEFGAVPAGYYTLTFIKSGFRASTMTDFQVSDGKDNVANFPMPIQATTESGEVLELDAFVVESAVVGNLMNNLELRVESDQLLNLLSSEDLSKFAASNVAEAMKRVAGVNVVEGRFAIIRGLEDRYSATLFNGAPVPSPDPDSQSVQLDLFPADIVSNIQVAKTFVATSPSNAAAGSIDIDTFVYPDELTLSLTASSGFNENTIDGFLRYQSNSPMGREVDGDNTIESDLSGSIGGRKDFFKRDFRFKIVVAQEIDYYQDKGFKESRQPIASIERRGNYIRSGGLSLGELSLSGGSFDLTESARVEQDTYYGAVGMDFDEAGQHRIDGLIFYSKNQTETVQSQNNGYLPNFDYGSVDPDEYITNDDLFFGYSTPGSFLNDYRTEEGAVNRGPLAFLPRFQSQSLDETRDLTVYQLNGEHDQLYFEGLSLQWVANYATTKQTETAIRARYWFEPDETPIPVADFIPAQFPSQVSDFGPGRYVGGNSGTTLLFGNRINENQYFFRADLAYEFEPIRHVEVDLGAGFWFEQANRKVDIQIADNPTGIGGLPGVVGTGSTSYVEAGTPDQLGRYLYRGVGLDAPQFNTQSDFKREISAWALESKFTFWDDLDLIGGVRLENIRIESENSPFNGECTDGNIVVPGSNGYCPDGFLPKIAPSNYVYIDRFDNPQNPFFAEPVFPPGFVFNDQILRLNLRENADGIVDVLNRGDITRSVNGEINAFKALPVATVAYRPLEGLTLRGSYSQTVARPSFRELGYYPTISFDVPEFILGNPQLQLSEVESWDARVEYLMLEYGGLFAFSFFQKTIQDPIEAIVLRDPSNLEDDVAYRIFRNNENDANLYGIELEARSDLGFLGPFFEYFSLGGNYTYIDAKVKRSQFELERTSQFFGATQADIDAGKVQFNSLSSHRRLFNQPEWIVNGDISFNQTDWKSGITLSVFAISDVLDAAGSTSFLPNGRVAESLVLDRYLDSFYQLDLVVSQGFTIPKIPGEWTFKTSIKNLTDSKRQVVYDTDQTNNKIKERSFKVGRDYAFSIGYVVPF
jgi:TonB-dependent receptor